MADIKIIVDSSDVVTADNRIENLGKSGSVAEKGISKAARGVNQFGTVAKNGGKKLNTFNMQLQQGGYQLQDFVVQLQGGTSFFTAFGQQGSQFAGVFGPQGAVIGAVIAIGSAVGGMAYKMLNAGDDVRNLEQAMSDLEDSVSSYASATKKASEGTSSIREEFGYTSVLLQTIVRDFEELARIKALDQVGKAVSRLRVDHLNGFQGDLENIADLLNLDGWFSAASDDVAQFDGLLKGLEDTSRSLKSRLESAVSLRDIILENSGGLKNMTDLQRPFYEQLLSTIKQMELLSKTIDKSSDASKRQNEYIKEMSDLFTEVSSGYMSVAASQTTLNSQAADYISKMTEVFELSSQLKEELGEAAFEALRLANVDMASGIDAATKSAAELAAQMGVSLEVALALQNLGATTDNKFMSMYEGGKFGAAGGTGFRDTEYSNLLDKVNNPKTSSTSGGAKESPQDKLAKYLQGKQQELELEKQLVGVFDEERQIQTELFNIQNDYKGVITDNQAEELQGTLRQIEAEKERQVVLEEVRADQQRLQDTITSSMENGFMAMIDGTMSVKEAFKQMAADIIKELMRVYVVQQMVNAAKGFFGGGGGLFGGASWSANGDVVGSSGIQAYADGGVVNSPTMFKHGGGLGVMGEAGPEAIMPLKRGANGKLGVQMEGGGGQNVVINQSFNFQANGDDSVKKIIAQAAPQIAQMTKSSLLNDRRRGGATKAAFG